MSAAVLATIGLITLVIINRSPSAKARTDSAATSDAKGQDAAGSTPPASTTPATTAPPTTSAPTTPSKPPTTAAGDAKTRLATSIKALSASSKGRLSVAVTDLGDSGTGASYADGSATYDTASIVKVDILATLLLRHQKAGTTMTSTEKSQATVMIQQSDNNAATALWNAVNRRTGLDAANHTFGMDHTQGGSADLWGLTQTTTADQQALLRVVFGDDSPLSAASRTYIKGLMHTVTKGQQWGVSAADEDGSGFALKNGWLQRSATGLWDINSIGEVDYKGHTLLVCVLSSGNKSEKSGIDKVEDAAAAAAKALYS
ncbi:class A beta-lactamase-related serine hydrolase [Streptomyces cocklensis]|uniref:Beta-lactamase class A n=1 Tax=Actinacidiphila cocklensis TaxID=887465 RepID=A0A9W4E8M5_9ACTN|nr:class A beta-lactamase-related serine hydrolase [Actinacidiphila cocklensis]MDD1062261.1 class A beta-lactamase-related serine hydrolase [Actinacidiphila cocklensis]WSX74152.1 class A beta-lactamase-related serine hydrolase [Streptomyces sp. NBC_00899]WSX79784.1 class A beta-lactamase-related serine hydrolase [Streptomyces sp. NBC_00899]CAG6395486.1 Beta-lactamase class A [Actinacidiphila cocklensis]